MRCQETKKRKKKRRKKKEKKGSKKGEGKKKDCKPLEVENWRDTSVDMITSVHFETEFFL